MLGLGSNKPMNEYEFALKQQQMDIDSNPNAVYADTIREDKATTILEQINPDNLLTDIEHRLRGEKKNPFTGEWELIAKYKEYRISEELISDFTSFLGATLNQNTAMSNYTEQEVNNIMEMIIEWVASNLCVRAKDYGIEGNYPEYTRIAHIICITCFSVFKRALNGQESRRVFGIMKISENLNGGQKKSFLDKLKFM